MQTPAGPKGTRDFYPQDMALQRHVFDSWQKTCRRFGFEEFEGPMFEHLELYTQKSGEEVERQLYTFTDKSDRHLALRPELTPTLARMVAQKGSALKRPVRWFAIPRLFRYEKMQRGRLREFFQLNMDILGIADVLADAELLAAVTATMLDLGLTAQDFMIHVSSRKLLEQVCAALGMDAPLRGKLYGVLDKLNKLPPEIFAEELAKCLPDTTQRGAIESLLRARTLADVAALYPGLPALDDLQTLLDYCAEFGIADSVAFDIGIVRGLAYYTGIVFEVFDTMRTLRAIAGGGRYDDLVKRYGGPDTPAVGFAAGDVVLAELLKAKNILVPAVPRCQVFIVAFDDAYPGLAIRTAAAIRRAQIACEFSLKKTGVGKQMEQAHAAQARFVLFVGGDEGRQGAVKIKDMADGTETTVNVADYIDILKRALQ
ncbi:MAG: histidine--tRNA ligase [Chitinivibrionales bacterium]|nr:histidine--tRNA ligase [Chitinivibrionales bacterium]